MGRGTRDPAVPDPALCWWLPGLRVRPAVVLLDDEPLEHRVELLQGERRRRGWLAAGAVRDVPGQMRQQLGGDGAVEPLDLAATLRDPDPGVDQPNVCVQADPLEARAGEVAAVVAVEHVRQAHYGPRRVALAAHSLVQRQCGLLGGRGA